MLQTTHFTPKRPETQRRAGAGHVDICSGAEGSLSSRSHFHKGFPSFSSAYSHSSGCADHMTSLLKTYTS